jgi:hypothetical protein
VNNDSAERVRRAIYDTFARQGRAPGREQIRDLAAVDDTQVDESAPPAGDEVAHFLVPMPRVWDDVVYTCANQRLFCSRDCVQAWLTSTGHAEGYVMDLTTLWNLASGWYRGRLDSPYEREDPQSAAGYFRSVGLHGPFWGLDD